MEEEVVGVFSFHSIPSSSHSDSVESWIGSLLVGVEDAWVGRVDGKISGSLSAGGRVALERSTDGRLRVSSQATASTASIMLNLIFEGYKGFSFLVPVHQADRDTLTWQRRLYSTYMW